jgi:hypothetical protein
VCVLNAAVVRDVKNQRKPRQQDLQQELQLLNAIEQPRTVDEKKVNGDQQKNEKVPATDNQSEQQANNEQEQQKQQPQQQQEPQQQQLQQAPQQQLEELIQSRFSEKSNEEEKTETPPPTPKMPKLTKKQEHSQSDLSETSITNDYDFSYSVNDNFSGDIKSQSETRRGGTVTGSYSLVDSDGFLRIVDYKADDKNGFTAEIRREPIIKVENPNPMFASPESTDAVVPPVDDSNIFYRSPIFTSATQIRSNDEEVQPQFDSQQYTIYNYPRDDAYYYLW